MTEYFEELAADLAMTEHKYWLLEKAARALITDVRSRHPGEPLNCPHMRALDAALGPKT